MILSLLAALSIFLTPERQVSPPVLQPANGDQYRPIVATTGHGWLAAWLDFGVFAARIDDDGNVVDRQPMILSRSGWLSAVAAGTNGYLVVWAERTGIYATVIDDDGGGHPRTTIFDYPLNDRTNIPVTAEYAGGRYLVAWDGQRVLLDERGALIEHPAAGAGSGRFLLVRAERERDVLRVTATRVGTDGRAGAPILLARDHGYATTPRWASNGAETLILWLGSQFHGVILGDDNRVTPVPPFSAPGRLQALVWTGRMYLAIFVGSDLFAVPISARGEVLGPPAVIVRPPGVNTIQDDVTAAWNGRTTMIAYGTFGAATGSDVWAKLVDAAGQPTDRAAVPIAVSLGEAFYSAVAKGTRGSVVVWCEALTDIGKYALFVTTLSGDAEAPARGAPIATSDQRILPHVATNGEWTLVVWQSPEDGALHALLLRADGLAAPAQLSWPGLFVGVVAWDGSAFVIAADRALPGLDNPAEVVVLRVGVDGVAAPPVALTPPILYGTRVSIASNGDGVLVAWTDHDAVTEAVRIGRDGRLSAVTRIASAVIECHVSEIGSDYVVGLSMQDKSVRWAIVSADGSVRLSAPRPPSSQYYPFPPHAARLGDGIVLAWIDEFTNHHDLRFARARADGTLIDDVATMDFLWTRAVELAAEGGDVRLVYGRDLDELPHISRVMTRLIKNDAH